MDLKDVDDNVHAMKLPKTADTEEHKFNNNSKFNLPKDYWRLRDCGPCI